MTKTDPTFAGFLKVARSVSVETERQLRGPFSYLEAIDQLFADWIPDAGRVKSATVAVLVLNAHANFRAGLSLALSGQLLPVFMALRGTLESVLYANAIAAKPSLEAVWLKRDQDDESRKSCRNEFTIGKMIECLATAQSQDFAATVRDAYDSTIDFGAHPNSRSMLRSVAITERASGDHALDFAYIHGPQSFEIRQAFVACAEIGQIAFLTALIASNGHRHVKALNEKALSIQGDLAAFIVSLGVGHSELD